MMIPVHKDDLRPDLAAALTETKAALDHSHCPHSGLSVAAGLVLEDGRTVVGINYESDSYGLTLCAERCAIARAQAEGRIGTARAMVLVARTGSGKPPLATPLTPCGACRQWLAELAERMGTDLDILTFTPHSAEGFRSSALTLLPGAFSMDSL